MLYSLSLSHLLLLDCLPNNTFGGIAYAFMNSWMSVYKDSWCNYVSAQLHEVGHNLNFGHAGEGSQEYGDQSGMMGFSYSQNDTPVMCFNAAKSWQAGWFADKSVTIDPNNDAGSCYSGPLYGQDSYTTSPADATVLIQLQSTSGTNYHIGFNGKQGSNSGTVEHGNRVLITTQAATGPSFKIANLGAGQSYTIANYDGSGRDVVISVTSVSGSDHAVIDIMCGPALCSSDGQCDDFNAVSLLSFHICISYFLAYNSLTIGNKCLRSFLPPLFSVPQMSVMGHATFFPLLTAAVMAFAKQERERTSAFVSMIVLKAPMPFLQPCAQLATFKMVICLKSRLRTRRLPLLHWQLELML